MSRARATGFGSGVKTGGSNTRLNSQGRYQIRRGDENSDEMWMFAQVASKGKSCDLKSGGRITAHIDWLQFVGEVPSGKQWALFAAVEKLTGEMVHLRPGKPTQVGNEYQNSGRSLKSVKFAWNNPDADGNCSVLISIPGKVVSSMKMLKVRELALEMVGAGLRATRLDSTIDDYGKRLNFSVIAESLISGNYSKFQTWRFQYSSKGGASFKLGSPESPRSTTIYDKSVESKGKIDSIRIETKFGAKLAHDVLLKWLMIDPDELGDSWEGESARYLAESVIGSINFINRQLKPKEKNLKRIPRLDWWQEFVDLIGGEIYHTALIPAPTLEKTSTWHDNQCFRSLVCVMNGFGDRGREWFEYRLQMAQATLKPVHLHRIEQFKQEYALYADELDFKLPKAG